MAYEQAAKEQKKIMCSGIKPTGVPTLGNYIGALKNWQEIQDSGEFNTIYFLADLHALTVRQTKKDLQNDIYSTFASLLAVGLDPKKSLIFIQSQVPTHAQMAWLLMCHTQFGELSRMTQFKDKSKADSANVNAGLFTYPSLMAGDILLYNADAVPVGEDQKQHVEITRDIAKRINNLYGSTLKPPTPYIPKLGARIMSLQDPFKKMSKTDTNEKGYISLLDEPAKIMKKLRSAITDSDMQIKHSPDKKGISNLIDIYCVTRKCSVAEVESEFYGKSYGEFKLAVAEAVIEALEPIRLRYIELMKNKDYLHDVASDGAQKALELSSKTLNRLYDKMGLVRNY